MTATVVAARLRELLDYDPATGVFTWRIGRRGAARSGAVAGTPDARGYIYIRVDGKPYGAHRLAWLYVHGYWPAGDIDHINQMKSDNRIANLRDVTRSQNEQNKPLRENNSSGYQGVSWHKRDKRWRAKISVNKRERHLGLFESPEAASAAYEAAAAELHTHRPAI